MTPQQLVWLQAAAVAARRTILASNLLGPDLIDAVMNDILATGGLADEPRFALACGNEPYADDKVCPRCQGRGYATSLPDDDITGRLREADGTMDAGSVIDLFRKAADEIELWRDRWRAENEAFKQVHNALAKHAPVF